MVFLVAGVAILINRYTLHAAAWAGLLIVLLTLWVYVPMLATARSGTDVIVGVNSVFDTMLFGRAVLFLAATVVAKLAWTQLQTRRLSES